MSMTDLQSAVAPGGPRALAALVLAALAATPALPAAAQSLFERSQAYDRCYRDAARRFGPAPRQDPRPGEDLVELARRRQDYEERYSRYLNSCLVEAEQRLRGKPTR
ncbi:MAG: hypothetical protein ACT4N4_17645 [Rhodospirillales bacterium]